MRAGGDLDVFPRVFRPMRDSDDDRNAEIARHIQHPEAASQRGEMGPQIPNVTVAKLIEVDLRALQAIVPPDRVGIPLDEFEETLDDRFLKRIAGRTTVRSRR